MCITSFEAFPRGLLPSGRPPLWWEKIAIRRQVVARVEVEKEGAPSGGGRAADAQHVPIVSLSGFLLGHKRTHVGVHLHQPLSSYCVRSGVVSGPVFWRVNLQSTTSTNYHRERRSSDPERRTNQMTSNTAHCKYKNENHISGLKFVCRRSRA